MLDFLTPGCQVCGALIRDAEAHQLWHDAIVALLRLALKPEASDQEWADYVARGAAAGPVEFNELAKFAGRVT